MEMIPLSRGDRLEDIEPDLYLDEPLSEDPTTLNPDEIDEISERLDNFEHYIAHLHERLGYLESELKQQSDQNQEFLLNEIDRLEADITQSREEDLNSIEDSLIEHIESLEQHLSEYRSEILYEVSQLESNTRQDELRDHSYRLEELEIVLNEIREEQLTASEVDLRLDKGLHMPLLASGAIVSGAIGIGLAISRSPFSVAALGLSVFLILTLKKTANKHKIKFRDVL